MVHFKSALRMRSRGTAKLLNSAVTVCGDYIVVRILGEEETPNADVHAQVGIKTTEEVRGYTVLQKMVPLLILLHNMGNPVFSYITGQNVNN